MTNFKLICAGVFLAANMPTNPAQAAKIGDYECTVVIHCARGQQCDPSEKTEGTVIADFSDTNGWETLDGTEVKRITVPHDLGRLVIEKRPEGTTVSRNLGPNLEYTETRILGPEVSTSVGSCSRINE